jgi:hypothetical protein
MWNWFVLPKSYFNMSTLPSEKERERGEREKRRASKREKKEEIEGEGGGILPVLTSLSLLIQQ